ncbi:hypothetical protein A3D08_01510 [Candidatus Roizmanbacteria bacterium RIFCSPHIGHO2_02_FULL_43_11]|uniref:Uncharacterized protein n=1 Tax=Candidatus Roizmanbacteria bacterium RIFCSPHIGHO2_02_FULL_43_11 TaxID=1802043 RepID=A0A1F7HKC1_9BACT|nr:MAG: hypothetical protein A3D08_01510 [Candidatus Roizmanbacteria bacterium RIFCSPHIGHO2_02_FULL_43_11]
MKYVLILLVILVTPFPVYAAKTYEAPTLSSTPREPDVRKDQGATLHFSSWTHIVPPETFSYDVYFQNGCSTKTLPRNIGRYWQITDICDFHLRSHFNKARAVPNRAWIIGFRYTDENLEFLPGLRFPENSLKIVYSSDYGQSWTMLKSSTVDSVNNTVAAITDKPGGYMVMAGFVNPATYYSYKEVKGISTRGSIVERIVGGFLSLFRLVR